MLGGHIEMWMVFAAALAFGVITGIFEPASQAAVPRLVADERLESGNSLVFFGDQLANFLGPAAAGALIGWFGMRAAETSPASAATDGSLVGVGVAFVVHAASFAVSIAFLAAMGRMAPATPDAENLHPLRAIGEAMHFVTSRSSLVTALVLLAAANLFTVGPLLVGVPVLADTRLAEGPAALGMILSGFAFGNLFGVVLAGSMARPAPRVLGAIVIALFVTFGAGIASLAWIERTWIAVPILAVIGIGNGFLGVTVVTYLQRATPPAMIGRVMSLMMIAMFAMMPASQAIAGFVIAMSPEALFLGAGAGLVVTGIVASVRREVREFGGAAKAAPAGDVAPVSDAVITAPIARAS